MEKVFSRVMAYVVATLGTAACLAAHQNDRPILGFIIGIASAFLYLIILNLGDKQEKGDL